MFVTDCPLMRSQQPALKKRDYLMYSGQKLMGLLSALLDWSGHMPISFGLQPLVACPVIRMNRATRLNRCTHKAMQAGCRNIINMRHPNPTNARSILLCCNNNDGFLFCLATPDTFFQPANVCLIYLNGSC